jgi:hypothetical protein
MAAYRYLTNRMTSLPLTTDREKTELQKILIMAKNNNFPAHPITRLKKHTQQKTHTDNSVNKTKKWATFTYHRQKKRKITNLFKQTDIKIVSEAQTRYNNKPGPDSVKRQPQQKQHLQTTMQNLQQSIHRPNQPSSVNKVQRAH